MKTWNLRQMRLADGFISFIFSYNKVIAIVAVLTCMIGATQVKKAVQPNNEINIWFSPSDTALQAYYKFQREFGNDRIITIAFKDDDGILTAFHLEKTQQLTSALTRVHGIHHVESITNTKDFRRIRHGDATRIKLTTWFEEYDDYNIPEDIRNAILDSPLMVDRFVNRAGTVTMLFIFLDPITQTDSKREIIIDNITKISSKILSGNDVHIGGLDIITNGLNLLSRHDFTVFTAIGFLLMFVTIFLLYRTWVCLVLSVLTICISIWLALGIHGWLGFRLNIFTVMVPVIVTTIGIIGVMHIINSYETLQSPPSSPQEMARSALKNIFYPSLFATLTTMVGFLSQATSHAAVLKEFGLLTSIAVCLTFLLSFVFGSLLLPLYKTPQMSESRWLDQQLISFSNHLIKQRKLYWAAIAIIVILSLYGISTVKIDMYPIGYFPRDHKVVRDHEFMTTYWGDYLPIDFLLHCFDSLDLKSPTLMKAIIKFDEDLSTVKMVKNTFSFTTVMDRFARVAYKRNLMDIMNDPILAGTFLKQFSKHIGDGHLPIVNQNKTKARLIITGRLLSVRELEKNVALIDSIGKNHFRKLGTLKAIGYPALYIKAMNHTFSSMFSSLLFAFVLIFTMMLVMLRNIKLALIALGPNMFPLIILLAVLPLLNINLDLATCTVTAVVLGISIDDTIFFLHHFKQQNAPPVTTQRALLKTQRAVGRIILLSSVVLFAGFAILLLASINTVLYFGILACVGIVAALMGELVILPLILTSRLGAPSVKGVAPMPIGRNKIIPDCTGKRSDREE